MLPPDPPPLPADRLSKPVRSGLATFLSLVLVLFLASAAFALLDQTLILFSGRGYLTAVSGLLALFMLLTGLLGCVLIAFNPAIPKRYFLPVSLFLPVASIAVLPLLVYFYRQSAWIEWGIALCQLGLGIFIVRRLRRGSEPGWPLVPASQLPDRQFSWGNLAAVVLSGVFVLLPVLLLYIGFSAHLAVAHFTDGFVALRPSGIWVQVRQYTRDDGRKITLVPMSHIGEPKFYHDLAASFPADSVILMEGVTDKDHLLAGRIDYSKMAAAAGGVEQSAAFRPPGEIVAADVDVSSFSPTTLDLLKGIMQVHAKGITPETLPILMKPTPPGLEYALFEDLLTARNRHLLEMIQARLPGSNNLIIPWGAAHMPGISAEILKSGFHVIDRHEYAAIRFGS